jgi:atypical dual specificity phosphatase
MALPYDFDWMVPEQIGAMSLPGPEDLPGLREAGITLLVSLPASVPPDELVRRAGLRLVRLPIENWRAPTEKQIREFIAEVRAELSAGGKVAVHCIGGIGRTGTLIACYLVSEGRTAEQAIDYVRARRPGSIETHEQERAVFAWGAEVGRGA